MHRRSFLGSLLAGLGGGLQARQGLPIQGRRIPLQESPLAGFQYHRALGVWPFLCPGEALSLRREPANPYDPNAIGVWFKNEHLGYVPRRENRTLAQLLDRGERLEAQIVRLRDDPNPWRRIRFRVDLRPDAF